MNYYLGWDVGAWHCKATGKDSKDAFAIMDSNGTTLGGHEGSFGAFVLGLGRGNNRAWRFVESFFSMCIRDKKIRPSEGDSFTVAIDTPLGWPKAFRSLLNLLASEDSGEVETTDGGENDELSDFELGAKLSNPLLHRKTEQSIGHAMSPVQDMIGSQSTKALLLLNSLGARRVETGVWSIAEANLTLLETYPAPCMRSLDFIERMKSVKATEAFKSPDLFDALVCATLAREYGSPVCREKLQLPHEAIDEAEGWIFVPKDHLDENSGISYGRLIERYGAKLSLNQLLTYIQIGVLQKVLLQPESSSEVCNWQSVQEWLRYCSLSNQCLQPIQPGFLRKLYRVLNPKTKPDKVPSIHEFDRISKLIYGQVETAGTP